MNHSVRARATEGKARVIYHAHTPSLIALTYVLPLTSRDFTLEDTLRGPDNMHLFKAGLMVNQMRARI